MALQDKKIMPPPWLAYREIERYSIGWRMGYGEDYIYRFGDWLDTLSPEERAEYRALFPEPVTWKGWWDDEDNSQLLEHGDFFVEAWQAEGRPKYTRQWLQQEISAGRKLELCLFWGHQPSKDGNVTTKTQDHAGYYDVGPEDLGEDVRSDIVLTLQEMGFDIEASHHEVADGQHEVDFRYADILTTADNVATFKIAVKAIAAKHNLHATFMPKPIYGINGSGMHCNVSLFKDGKNAFYDPNAEYELSETAKYAIGGMLKHVKSITAILNPTVNSYKRLVPGYEAPVYLAWSLANRSALLRVPAKRGNSTRVELRSPDPACNPYLAFAAILEACLDGVRNKIDPPAPVESNIYKLTTKERKKQRIDSLPGSLAEALEYLDKSLVGRAALGEHAFNEFMSAKRKEWDSFRTYVSQWEIDRYLERY